MRTRTALSATAVALLAVTLTACSGSSSSDDKGDHTASPAQSSAGSPSSSPTAGDTVALEQSVRDYAKALFGADGPAGYRLLSKRCQGQTSEKEFTALAKQAHQQYGTLTIKHIHVDQISGDLARVSYGVGVPQFERKQQPWAREGGTWRWDACQAS